MRLRTLASGQAAAVDAAAVEAQAVVEREIVETQRKTAEEEGERGSGYGCGY